jgi:hypothetical protein
MHHTIEPSANQPQPLYPQLNEVILPAGWLERQIESTRAEIAQWPAGWRSTGYGEEICAHDQCQSCHGTGRKRDGSACVHMLSCRCRRCNPASM